MRVRVNKEKCIGCGMCESICPEVFEIGDDGKAQVAENADFERHKEKIEEAKISCPAEAIEIE
jgi:ferredoxin